MKPWNNALDPTYYPVIVALVVPERRIRIAERRMRMFQWNFLFTRIRSSVYNFASNYRQKTEV